MMCIENNYSNGRHTGGSSTRWGGSLLCRSQSNLGMKNLPRYGQSKSAARVAMEVALDISAWGRCHPRPSFFLRDGPDSRKKKWTNQHQQSTNLIWDTKTTIKQNFCANQICRQICKKNQQMNRQIWFSGTQIWNLSTCWQISNLSICRFFKKSTDRQINNQQI
jgi:hypothetical protein